MFSLVVLVPTLRDEMATIPLGTDLPSAVIGLIYGTAFATLGMTLSAFGAVLTGLKRSSRDSCGVRLPSFGHRIPSKELPTSNLGRIPPLARRTRRASNTTRPAPTTVDAVSLSQLPYAAAS
ncbi:hypothetical protein [Haladaptatus sp. NG-WS-4]